jgi:multimeric flavodoxin WrbA
MNALILNGSENSTSILNMVSDYLEDALKENGYDVDVMTLRNEKIEGCLGCFGCWLKTPGECIIQDAGSDLPKRVIQSDLVFLLSPITFGMYSHQLKKALDRFPCPILLPFFAKIDGEYHHSKRYDKYPLIVAVGVLPNRDEESEKTFTTLVERNGVNLHAKVISSVVYSNDETDIVKQKVIEALSKAGVK